MKQLLTGLAIIFALFSCNNEEESTVFPPKNEEETTITPFLTDDPALFMGSSFGEFFQVLHKTGRYEEMLLYTDQATKEIFTKEELMEFFQNMNFSYPLDLRAEQGNVLLYKTTIDATEKTLQFPFRIENDTVRAVFEELNVNQPFQW